MVTLSDLKWKIHIAIIRFKQWTYRMWFKWYYFKERVKKWLDKWTDKLGKILKKHEVIPEDAPT